MVSAKSSCRDVTVMCESVPGSPPPFLFFVRARGEKFSLGANESTRSVHANTSHRRHQISGLVYFITVYIFAVADQSESCEKVALTTHVPRKYEHFCCRSGGISAKFCTSESFPLYGIYYR